MSIPSIPSISAIPNDALSWPTRLLWIALPACGSVLLLAITNQLCQDVAVVPFLWVLPLSLYLLSFIVCFGHPGLYYRPVWWVALAASVWGMVELMVRGPDASLGWQVAGYSAGMFVGCMVCHGELVRLRPSARHLTAFYLATAAGGALGGLFVGVVAPAVFPFYLELHVGIFACCALAMAAFWHDVKPHQRWERYPWMISWAPAFLFVLGWLGLSLWQEAGRTRQGSVLLSRNFYGTLRVVEGKEGPHHVRVLQHGRIFHGWQTLDGAGRREPMSYFASNSGAGLLFRSYPRARPLRVGVIGLGAGMLAAYGQKGDHFTFYEINPAVEHIAETYFAYLKDLRAIGGACDTVLGDARLSLAREAPETFDILALDAFSGDAIPVHLLTKEAFEIYRRVLKQPGGVLALHISNRYLDLYPVVLAQARELGLQSVLVRSEAKSYTGKVPAVWALVSPSGGLFGTGLIQEGRDTSPAASPRPCLWTDDYSNLLQILR